MKRIVLNLKMNFDFFEVRNYANEITKIITGNPEVVVCPSYPFLGLFQNSLYELGAQDVSEFINGDHTGSVSAKQLSSLNVKNVIISHSERKKVQDETPEVLVNKIRNAISNKIKVIVCFNETLDEKKSGKTEFLIRQKMALVFNKLNKEELSQITIAYEPEWTRDSFNCLSNEEIDKVADYIKKEFSSHYGLGVEVLYGGGINAININTLMKLKNITGFMLGKSALDIRELNDIITATTEKF